MDAKALRQEFFLVSSKFHNMNMGSILIDLTRSEFMTLEMTYRYMENNQNAKGICVSELAKCQKTSPPSVSRTLKGMEEKGWIGRTGDRKDRRNTYIYLTENGKAKRKETADTLERFTERVMERMGCEKLKQLLQLTSELEEYMRQEIECLQVSKEKTMMK